MKEKVAAMIQQRTGMSATQEAILASTDLFRDGFLDSLASVSLVHELEREFQVKIGPFLITRTNLASVDAIMALVERRRAKP
ncbi:MAG: hypothetical protein HUU37_01380 [Bdellovibrionales bacterium]|nr:hypothetical protein [Bdellovibrionales bacterium]